MIVLKNIAIILFSIIICSHALTVEPRTKPAVQVEGEGEENAAKGDMQQAVEGLIYRIVSGVRVGEITRETTEADLRRIYGTENVENANIPIGEGDYEPGTVLFPKDPTKKVEILWEDIEKRSQPKTVLIKGVKSEWQIFNGITLGTKLNELQRINGKPFVLTGFGWDYEGTVISWEKGNLKDQLGDLGLPDNRKVILRLVESNASIVSAKEYQSVLGDKPFSSSHPVMRKLNPGIYQIVAFFSEKLSRVDSDVQVEGKAGKLEFRILPNSVGSSRYPISPFELPKYVEELKKNGPEYGKDYIWLPIELKVGKEQDNLIKREYDGRIYVLASNKRAETMADDGSWNISGVDRERDGNAGDYHSITARFDEYGQHLFSSLTNSHVGHVLAIVRDGKVIYTSLIKRRMWKAAIAGDFTEKQTANLMYIFEDYRKPWQEHPPFLHNLDRQVWSDYIEATEALAKGQDRAKLAKTFLTIGSKYPQTTHCQTAIELGHLLENMVKEDRQFEEPEDVQALNQSKKVEYYIYKLRDVSEQDIFVPGKIHFLRDYPRMDTPVTALRKMGRDVVPAMIKHLKDRRPTRSVGSLPNGGAVTRNCDVALEIIESIAGRKFDFRTSRGTYLSTASERLRDKIIEDVKQWWQKNRQQPGVQVEGDFHVTRQKFLRLLAPPEPQLRHAREAIQLFKAKQDWPSLAIAYEVAAETMWRITHMAPEAFTRPVTEQATDVRLRGRLGLYVMVQTNLDGEWVKGKGERQNWIDWIQRKQKDLALERIAVLKKLGALCLDRLDDPPRAVLAYEATGRGVPVCTEPLETLIAQMWPVLKVEANEILALDQAGAAHIRLEPLQRLAEAQVTAGNLRGAADTHLRAMLTALIGDRGDWNAHGSTQEAEAFWQVVRR
ncbi:MAG: SecDF P1 head subdomain-containing protein, partial [Planctomycetota bacterium]